MIDRKLKEMIGQMIMVGFQEAELTGDSPVARAVKDFSLGGVVLYNIDLRCFLEEQQKKPEVTREEAARICPRNIISPEQIRDLTSRLKSYAKIPLLIAADQEGGLVSRLGPAAGFPETPSPERLGEKDEIMATWKAAGAIAADLGGSGINLNLAPVKEGSSDHQRKSYEFYGKRPGSFHIFLPGSFGDGTYIPVRKRSSLRRKNHRHSGG